MKSNKGSWLALGIIVALLLWPRVDDSEKQVYALETPDEATRQLESVANELSEVIESVVVPVAVPVPTPDPVADAPRCDEPSVDPVRNGVLKISTPTDHQGTAIVVKQNPDGTTWLATAWHVVQFSDSQPRMMFAGDAYTINFPSGPKKATCVSSDPESDLAILKTKTSDVFEVLQIDETTTAEPSADETNHNGEVVEVYGFARGAWLKTVGRLRFSSDKRGYSWADCVGVSGQSGGPVVRGGRLVGILSGGAAWFASKSLDVATWPARFSQGRRLKEMVQGLERPAMQPMQPSQLQPQSQSQSCPNGQCPLPQKPN